MSDHEVLVILNSSRFGQGNPQLGEKLMKAFLESLSQAETKPAAILLYNSAVMLATSQSPLCDALAALEKAGVEILVNEESLDFYALSPILKAGKTVDMAAMSEKMLNASLIVKP